MRHVRGYSHDASKNIKALWAAGPIKEDAELASKLNALANRFRALESELSALKNESYELAARYLKDNQAAITKDYEITAGSPSMRLRLKSKADRW